MGNRVLVTGATGKQGGAVARALRSRGHDVRAMTRRPDAPAAAALEKLGAEVVAGDLGDRASVDRALWGADAVFVMGTPFEAGTSSETAHGILAVDAAKAAGVRIVYTSVANADRATGIPHFDSKFAVEQHLRVVDPTATILAPAYFMENLGFVKQQLREGVYPSPVSADRKLAQVAVRDIAAAAVAVLEDPAHHAGQRYDLGGDELSANESIAILSRVLGKPLQYFQLPMDMVRATMGEDGARMYTWFESTGYTIDRGKLAAAFPGITWTTFEAWARSQDWATFLG